MSVHTQIQCDGCAKVVSDTERQKLVWTEISLHLQHGMSRVHRTFDLCPACQDKIELYVLRYTSYSPPKPTGFNRWTCPRCHESGDFAQGREGLTMYPSGEYDWHNYPEMRCACRRTFEALGQANAEEKP